MKNAPILIFDVITLFPEMLKGPLSDSMIGRAQQAGILEICIHNLRRWSDDPRHQKVDDRPFGGGAGMVLRPEPLYRALKVLGAIGKSRSKPWVVYLSPQGATLTQKKAKELAGRKRIILICGHYEGIDERVMEWVDEEVSIGDFVLTGGEIPALVVMDAVGRLVPGVVGDPTSIENESHMNGLLDFPHYTRPSEWKGRKVPDVLLSGHHGEIGKWRSRMALKQTRLKKPWILSKDKKVAS